MQNGKTPGTVLDVTEFLTLSNIPAFRHHSCLCTATEICASVTLQSMTTTQQLFSKIIPVLLLTIRPPFPSLFLILTYFYLSVPMI